jgi:cysteine-rich repeat protein
LLSSTTQANAGTEGGFFSWLAQLVGLGGDRSSSFLAAVTTTPVVPNGTFCQTAKCSADCVAEGGRSVPIPQDGCNEICEAESCGDGVIQQKGRDNKLNTADDESCDNGSVCSNNATQACRSDSECNTATCRVFTDGSFRCSNNTALVCSGNEDCNAGNTCVYNAASNTLCSNKCQGIPLSICGDGIKQANEECDIGGFCQEKNGTVSFWSSQTEAKACRDRGGASRPISGDGCSDRCQFESCGDGVIQAKGKDSNLGTNDDETCDNGSVCSNNSQHACRQDADCKTATCSRSGDGSFRCSNNASLQCSNNDDCNAGVTCKYDAAKNVLCTALCRSALCGNGRADTGEQCRDGSLTCPSNQSCNSATCLCNAGSSSSASSFSSSSFSVSVSCGDRILQNGEQCDDGNFYGGDGCSGSCFFERAVCGDHILQNGETCDDGNTLDGDGCDRLCRLGNIIPACGDRIVTAGETCDDGNLVSGDGCAGNCQIEHIGGPGGPGGPGRPGFGYCGDHHLNAGETCDDGNNVSLDGCTGNCLLEKGVVPRCGDNMATAGEECDDGNNRSFDGCSNDCHDELARCGDYRLQLGEQCEPPNQQTIASLSYGCGSDCRFISYLCGDGKVDAGEQCDQGAENNDTIADRCRTNCSLARCGDAMVDGDEQCDDGNRISGDGCDLYCKTEAPSAPEEGIPGIAGNIIDLPLPPGAKKPPVGRPGLPGQPVATLNPVIVTRAPGNTQSGPAALVAMAAGASAGFAWLRRRRRK